MEGVERRQIAFSRNAERMGHAMDDQLVHQETAATSLRNLIHQELVNS